MSGVGGTKCVFWVQGKAWSKVPTSKTISVICAWDCDVELRAKSNGTGDRCTRDAASAAIENGKKNGKRRTKNAIDQTL